MDAHVAITLTSRSGKSSDGVAHKLELTTGDRLTNTAIKAGLLFALTLLGSLIPFLHLVVFLGGVFVTVLLSIKTYRITTMLSSGHGVCPECSSPFRILQRPWDFPFIDPCEGCGREITIQIA